MWSEYVSPETIDSRIWPRTAAIAERFWSPGSVADVDDMYRRLAVTSVRLEELGLTHEKNYRSLLRRMAGGKEIGPLETLVSVVEPVKQYNRGKQRPTTMLSPLTGFVDAPRPDSEASRQFAALVAGFLADAPRFQTNREEMERALAKWRDARPAIEAITGRSAILREAEPLAAELSDLAQAGLEALACLAESKAPDGQWGEVKMAILQQAAKPKPSAVEFAILPSVRQLVIAAIELPQLRGQPPLEWQKRVKTLAEVARLFDVVRTLRAAGAAVLFISHRLEEVFEICQRVTVMRDGRHVLTSELAGLFRAYTARKRARNLLDFDDLLLLWQAALADPVAGPVLRGMFDAVLVDEYQDVNAVQASIVRLLQPDGKQLTCVGDDAQAIYGFRGADPAHLRQLTADYPGLDIVRLDRNYRSRQGVLELANVIRPSAPSGEDTGPAKRGWRAMHRLPAVADGS